MARGRKPLPPALKAASENAQRTILPGPLAQLREAGEVPKPECIALDCEASDEWDRLLDLLGPCRLSPVDMALLSAYCSAWSSFVEIREALRGQPLTLENERTGAVKTHPLRGALSVAEASLVKFAVALGIGPAERGRITMPHDLSPQIDDSKDLSKWMTG